MDATLTVDFVIESDRRCRGHAELTLDLAFTPSLQIEFEHPVWHESRKPIAISYNTEKKSFWIRLGTDELNNEEEVNRIAEMYKSHGWTVNVTY
jgi:hypothetical protein